MSAPPLEVAVLWHMHQPDYRDRVKGRAVLPWVRLHAVKDYYPMAALVEEFPELRVTFNCVPSLFDQLADYVSGRIEDEHLAISAAPAADLDAEAQSFLLGSFFMGNYETMIRPHPRYLELLEKRGPATGARSLEDARRRFSARDLRDLQVWFNLAWFGPYFLQQDPLLVELQRKGQGFSEEEKALLLARQREIAAAVVPLLKRLAASGRIEISTTPYYHPILPLLVDTDVARVSVPDVVLPRLAFRHPEDARRQVRAAVRYHETTFGEPPQGIWPSEGSVSAAVVALLREEGFRWTATDENILFRSLGLGLNQEFYRSGRREELLYQPFALAQGDGRPAIFFRDHVLSDLVGFSYSRWDPVDAVEDFTARLRAIAEFPAGRREGRVVPVILDGENAWEYYPDGGLSFLRGLYAQLTSDPGLVSTTFRGHLERHPVTARIPDVFPGSWINNNFAIWIGHREDNRAWDLLGETREALVRADATGAHPPERIREAWEVLSMAEGSDWCWWYGDDHSSGNDEVFDELFRRHLMNVYHLIGETAPEDLLRPVIEGAAAGGVAPEELASLIHPRVDGRISSYFEWLGAVAYEIHRRGQTMHRADVPVTSLHYGISLERLFLRVDLRVGYHDPQLIGDAFLVTFGKPRPCRVVIPTGGGGRALLLDEDRGLRTELPADTAAWGEILEVGLPWETIGAAHDDTVSFTISLEKQQRVLALWPMTGEFSLTVPGPNFTQRMWSV